MRLLINETLLCRKPKGSAVAEAHPWGDHAPGMQESLLGDQSSADPTLTPSESMAGCSARGDMSGEHSDTLISNLSQGLCAADCPWTHQGTFFCVFTTVFLISGAQGFLFVTQTRTTASHKRCVWHRTQAAAAAVCQTQPFGTATPRPRSPGHSIGSRMGK